MRKSLILALMGLVTSISLSAQNNATPKIELGIKGGVNASTISSSYKKKSFKLGYNAGISLNYYVTDNIYLNTGLEYITKGSDLKNEPQIDVTTPEGITTNVATNASAKYRLNYIQLPLAIGYNIVDKTNLIVNIHGGMYVAYGVSLSVKEKFTISDGNGNSEMKIQYDNWDEVDLHRFDAGAVIGTGLKFDRLFFDLSYYYGLTNIGNSAQNMSSTRLKWNNHNFALSAGFNFYSK